MPPRRRFWERVKLAHALRRAWSGKVEDETMPPTRVRPWVCVKLVHGLSRLWLGGVDGTTWKVILGTRARAHDTCTMSSCP
ncbi:hypothetical protein TNCV_4181671 [Trichonephila clavipes]|nr:hypothetical protein TNCV_4181671 [Trichonephila clavipes]